MALLSMDEKKSKIIIEDVGDNGLMSFSMEGDIRGCANLIAQHYVTERAFREAVNAAMRCILEIGVDLLEQQRAKDMGDED